MSSSTSFVDLLIVGAGPAGLTAACWAAQYQMSTRIIDQKGSRTETGHADGIQSRTLEILESFGIVDPILNQGIHDVDMAHWATEPGTGNIERHKRYEADSGQSSRFGQIMLNQGAVEQVLVDYLRNKNVYVERHKEAKTLHLLPVGGEDKEEFPVIVRARSVEKCGVEDTIHARYLIACDGAHSWVRNQLDVQTDEISEASTWGVLDIVPITDFRLYDYPAVFLAGDAAHTHSPKGGQGMNVSIQDAYNLIWKLGAVITNGAQPTILETYETERRPVAKQLMTLDSRLVRAYEDEENDNSSGIYEVREQYAGFMAGIDITYPHSTLVTQGEEDGATNFAKNLRLGMRLPSFLVVYQCDGVPIHLAKRLGIQVPKGRCPILELLLIQSSPRSAVNLLDLPELFHPFDHLTGWDYWKAFADDRDQAYKGQYGKHF
ncbi:hypothetical protein N7534_004903 [Penicillium rubens]|nr:hypothetical protein N7534_004903 [Penicillium rubens]